MGNEVSKFLIFSYLIFNFRAKANVIAGRIQPLGGNKVHFDFLVSVELNEKAIPEHVSKIIGFKKLRI